MKVVKFYWEFHMSDEVFEGSPMKELINEVKSGKFQRDIEEDKYHNTGGKIQKCIATVKVE